MAARCFSHRLLLLGLICSVLIFINLERESLRPRGTLTLTHVVLIITCKRKICNATVACLLMLHRQVLKLGRALAGPGLFAFLR